MGHTELIASQRRFLAWLLIALVFVGCGSSTDFVATGFGADQTAAGAYSGIVQLSPRRPVGEAKVEMLDRSGRVLAQATTRADGTFLLEPSGIPDGFTARATLPNGTVLDAVTEGTSNQHIIVDLMTTLIAKWQARHPGKRLAEATREVLDFLAVPQRQGGDGAFDDSISSEFDPDVFLEQAEQNGGIQLFVDRLLDRLASGETTPPFVSFVPGISGNFDVRFLALMERNLAGPGKTDAFAQEVSAKGLLGDVGPETFAGPIAGFLLNWVAGEIGLNATLNTVQRIEATVNQLSLNLTLVQNQLKVVLDTVLVGFYDEALAQLNAPEAAIVAGNAALSTALSDPGDYLRSNSLRAEPGLGASVNSLNARLGEVQATLVGNSAGSKGILRLFLEKSRMPNLMDQARFDGLTFLVVRERNLRTSALRTLIELIHVSMSSNMINEATLAFDREMLRIKSAENEAIKQLELNGTSSAAVSGFTHAEKGWASRTLDSRTLEGLVANAGILATPLERTVVLSRSAGAQDLSLDSVEGFDVGNLVTIDSGERQEVAIVKFSLPDAAAIDTLIFSTPLHFAHPAGAVVRRTFDPAISSPNLLYDNDASVIWLKTPIAYFDPQRWGFTESGFFGWLAPNRQQLRHLLGHVGDRQEIRSFQGLRNLGFTTLLEPGFSGIDAPKESLACISTPQAGNEFVDVIYDVRADRVLSVKISDLDVRNHLLSQLFPMLAVYQPELAVSSLEVKLPTASNAASAGVAIPGSSLSLDVTAKMGQRSGVTAGPSVRRIAIWTVVSGPKTCDPLVGSQGQFDNARLRISNAPGSEGRLEVRELPGDSASSPDEVYVVEARLGSNTGQATLTVKPSRRFVPTRPASSYVSHTLTRSQTIVPGGSTALLRAFGRFKPVESAEVAYGTTTDVGLNITEDPNLEWRILNDSGPGGPDATKIASIPLHPTAGTGTALLTINKNVPGHPIPPGGIFVTVLAEWKGALPAPRPTAIARAKFLVTP